MASLHQETAAEVAKLESLPQSPSAAHIVKKILVEPPVFTQDGPSSRVQSSTENRRARFIATIKKKQNRQFAAACLQAGVGGWNDACAGTPSLVISTPRLSNLTWDGDMTLFPCARRCRRIDTLHVR